MKNPSAQRKTSMNQKPSLQTPSMADSDDHRSLLHRYPQKKPIDAVRWLPSSSPFHRLAAFAVHSPSSLEIHSLYPNPNPNPNLALVSSYPLTSRITSLRSAPNPNTSFLAASTSAGSLHFVFIDPVKGFIQSELSISDTNSFHSGPIQAIDIEISGRDCVTAGEDGRVNIVNLDGSAADFSVICDMEGLVAYTAVKWASPAEFVTGGVGPGLQWWDRRKPGVPAAQFKGIWGRGIVTGMVHSIDIHPSRKHICMVGGSSGTVFAWDLRWQDQPIVLSGVGIDKRERPVLESEIWEVKYDFYTPQGDLAKVPPVMVCSEDGFLSVLRQDENPVALLAEPCAINSFDIDPQNPTDVIFASEWESVGVLMRGREAIPVL